LRARGWNILTHVEADVIYGVTAGDGACLRSFTFSRMPTRSFRDRPLRATRRAEIIARMDIGPQQPQIGDAWGRVLARCWAAGGAPWSAVEMIERDDGFISAGDPSRYFTAPDEWSDLDRWAWEQATGRILDVGCGGGRHAVAWAERGLEAVGLDPSAEAVRITRERGVEALVGALPALPDGLGGFDTIAMFGNNLALLGGPKDGIDVLAALAAVAQPGARLLGRGTNPLLANADNHADYHAWNKQRGRRPGQLRLRVRDGIVATPWFDYWFATPDDVAEVVRASPWRLEAIERASVGGEYVVCLRR
jgi:SAM-dependent methyltransferase